MNIQQKRIYEQADKTDGCRVLVDRLWPRGISRSDAAIDVWAKELAPSPELRKWYGHDIERWEEFRRRYKEELAAKKDQVAEMISQATQETVTFVFAAKDIDHSNAQVLKEFVDENWKLEG